MCFHRAFIIRTRYITGTNLERCPINYQQPSLFYTIIIFFYSATSAVSWTNLGSILIFASCVVHRSPVFSKFVMSQNLFCTTMFRSFVHYISSSSLAGIVSRDTQDRATQLSPAMPSGYLSRGCIILVIILQAISWAEGYHTPRETMLETISQPKGYHAQSDIMLQGESCDKPYSYQNAITRETMPHSAQYHTRNPLPHRVPIGASVNSTSNISSSSKPRTVLVWCLER